MRACSRTGHRPILFRLGLCGALQFRKAPALHAHPAEDAVLLLDEVVRRVELDDAPRVEDEEPVVVDDGSQTMGDYTFPRE